MTLSLAPDSPARFVDMTLVRGVQHAPDDETKALLAKLLSRVNSVKQQHEIFRQWCDRADDLYYPFTINENSGADLFPDHESAQINGRQHVSVNEAGAYVDIPSSMQAEEPVEDMLPTGTTEEDVTAAAAEERVYVAWKQAEDFDLKWHKAITTKSLYGMTASRIYYDKDLDRPCIEIVQQPRNLYLGWKTDSYEKLEWAAYKMFYEPNSLTEQFGVEVVPFTENGDTLPFVQQRDWDEVPARPTAILGTSRVEVWDYWYRQPVWKGQKFIRMDTYNVVVGGNIVLRGPIKYPEYKGQLPYLPVFNTYVPGMPNGKPDLYDVEPLIRETSEAITRASQMIANVTSGDSYQLVGPEAPLRVPQGLKPIKGGIIAPGPGNRVEVITPFVAQFQFEQYMGRIDRHKTIMTGLNDLLLGLAPAQVLSSSKAINALIANYAARLSIRLKLLYKWRRDNWTLARAVGSAKSELWSEALPAEAAFLKIDDPSLNPRDELETATRALNLVNGKLWSQRRAMNVVGVDDPETEQDYIREERTDATMFPADVQVMAQLLGALQALGLQAPAAQGMAQQQLGNGQNDLRNALGAATPDNSTSSQLAGDQGETPPIPGAAPTAGGEQSLVQAPDNQPVLQGMVQGGEAKGRIMTQQRLGRR